MAHNNGVKTVDAGDGRCRAPETESGDSDAATPGPRWDRASNERVVVARIR
jgi:hypothetical protein